MEPVQLPMSCSGKRRAALRLPLGMSLALVFVCAPLQSQEPLEVFEAEDVVDAEDVPQGDTLEVSDAVLEAVGDGPVATVDGRDIPAEEFAAYYVGMVRALPGGEEVPDEARIRVARACLKWLVGCELLYTEASRRGLKVTDQEARDALRAMCPEEVDDEQLDSMVGDEASMASFKRSLLIMQAASVIADDVAPEDTKRKVEALFEEAKEEFPKGEQVRFRQIFFLCDSGATGVHATGCPGCAEARERAEETYKQIRAGRTFESAVKSVENPRIPDTDRVFTASPEQLPPPLAEALSNLEPGQSSGVVKTDFGYHIVQLEKRFEPRELTLEDLGPQVFTALQQQMKLRAVQEFCQKMASRKGLVEYHVNFE